MRFGVLRGVATCCLLLALQAAGAEAEPPLLADYLDTLNASGQRIIYSGDLVERDMRLAAEPPLAPSLAELDALLQPFGLTARPGPANSILVTRMPRQADAITPSPQADKPPISEIVVTSSLHRLDRVHTESHTYLDRELAARLPTAAEDAVRLTRRLPGTASEGVSAKTHVRGGQTDEVLFLFDGLRLYEPYHLKDFQSIATIINAGVIGGMDFYTGAYPARYGDRMSGVLSLDLREPEAPLETELALSFFNASALSLGTFGASGQGNWLVSARRSNLDLIVDVIDPDFGSPDYRDYQAHVGWSFGPRGRLSANVLVSDDNLRLRDDARGERATAAYVNQVGWLRWRADWSDALSSDTIIALSDIRNRRTGELDLPQVVAGRLDEDREFRAFEIRQDWRWLVTPAWMLRYGYNVKGLDGDYRFTSTQTLAPPFAALFDNAPQTSRDIALAPSGEQFAAYAELRWQPSTDWTIDLGLRWDRQNYTTADDDRQYSPRASLLFKPSSNTEWRLGWGQYYQAQEINELQVSDGITNYFPAQQAEHFVLNLQHGFVRGFDASVTLYRKSFRRLRPRFENAFNRLTLLPELQFDRLRIDPEGAEARGAELLISRGDAGDDLLWWIGYDWSRIEDQTRNGDVVRSWDQTHTLKGGLGWRWRGWDFSTAIEVRTGWPRTELAGMLVPQPGGGAALELDVSGRNTTRHRPFHTLDIRISREFDIAVGDLTAFLDVTNLYDRLNPCCTEYSVRTDGTLARRAKRGVPLVPSLGIVWRF